MAFANVLWLFINLVDVFGNVHYPFANLFNSFGDVPDLVAPYENATVNRLLPFYRKQTALTHQ